MTEINSFISQVGFPIVMCLLMWKSNQDTLKTVDANTDAIKKLISRLDTMGPKGGESNNG